MVNLSDFSIGIKNVTGFYVAGLEYEGAFEGNAEIFDELLHKILNWAKPEGLFVFPEVTKLVSIYYDVDGVKKLFFGITIRDEIIPPDHITKIKVPTSKCAVGEFEVLPTEYGFVWDQLYNWVEDNQYIPADQPAFEIQHNDSCTHAEGKHIVSLYIPLVETE